jgi:hypothetical protein
MICDRVGCMQETSATITLYGEANAEEPGTSKTYRLCSQHYYDCVHVIKTLQMLVALPITTEETVYDGEERSTWQPENN